MNPFTCRTCFHKFWSIESFITHLRKLHFNISNELVECPFCFTKLRNRYSTYYHFQRYHRTGRETASNAAIFQENSLQDEVVEECMEEDRSLTSTFNLIEDFVTKLNYKAAQHNLPKSAVNDLVLVLLDVMEAVIKCETPAEMLYEMKSYCQSNFKQKKLMENVLEIPEVKSVKASGDVFHYTSFVDSLGLIFNSKNGKQWLGKNTSVETINLQLFVDDFTFTNPLNSNSTTKLFACYFTIHELDYENQCRRQNVNLLMLARRRTVKLLGVRYLFRPFLEELRQNPTVTFGNRTFTLSLKTITGDNLGIHEIAGLSMSFNSGCVCRYCFARYEQLKNININQFVMRTKENWFSVPRSNPKYYGTIRTNPFMSINDFDISKSLPPDILHDLLEGIIPRFMNLMIENILEKDSRKWNDFKLNYLSINHWENGTYKIDETQIHFKGKAVKMLEFFLKLPEIVKEKYKHKSSWVIYLALRGIVAIVYSNRCDEQIVDKLRQLTRNFVTDYVNHIENNVFPKLHYLLHYPDLMQAFGPLHRFSTLRYERKHAFFKQTIQKSRNTRNVTLTASRKHAMIQALGSMFFDEEDIVLKIDSKDIVLCERQRFFLNDLRFDARHRVKSLTINRLALKRGMFFAVGKSSVGKNVFGKVVDIYCTGNLVPIILGERYEEQKFITEMFAYTVKITDNLFEIKKQTIVHHMHHNSFKIGNTVYVNKCVEL